MSADTSGTFSKPIPAPKAVLPATTGSTVTVGSKLPGNLLLQLHKLEERQEPVFGGGWKTVKVATPVGKTQVIRGISHPINRAPSVQIIGGYGLTPNVDADLFAEWLRQNADSDIVKNRLVFAHEKADHAAGIAAEQAEIRSGMEPIDPDNIKIPGIKTADVK